MRVMLDFSIPVGFGVITTKNIEQAQERSGNKNNKGSEATQAVLEMLSWWILRAKLAHWQIGKIWLVWKIKSNK